MTESELDGLLLLAYFPKRKEKLNLANRDIFITTIMKKISDCKLENEFGESFVALLPSPYNSEDINGASVYMAALCEYNLFKMAALKTYDDYKEFVT